MFIFDGGPLSVGHTIPCFGSSSHFSNLGYGNNERPLFARNNIIHQVLGEKKRNHNIESEPLPQQYEKTTMNKGAKFPRPENLLGKLGFSPEEFSETCRFPVVSHAFMNVISVSQNKTVLTEETFRCNATSQIFGVLVVIFFLRCA